MVAHCMSPEDDLNSQKSRIKLSSGFVIGDGLIVTCAHTFEEVSSYVVQSDKHEKDRYYLPSSGGPPRSNAQMKRCPDLLLFLAERARSADTIFIP